MKRFLLNVATFFFIVGIIDISVGGLGNYLQHHAKGGEFRMFDDLVLKDKHDIIVLGSSRAHCHYDTPLMSKLMDRDVYNAGYDGNGVVLSVGIMDMILERYKPQMLLFDVEPAFDIVVYEADNNHKRYLHRLKPYYNQSGIDRIFKDVSLEEWLKVHVGMIRYNTVIVPLLIDNLVYRGKEEKGYNPAIGQMAVDRKIDNDSQIRIDSFKLHYVQELIEISKRHDVPLLMVASPKYGEKNSEALNPIKIICAENGIPFIDYYANADFVTHKELFKEPMHLNNKGAEVFTQQIVTDIINNYY